MPTRRTPARKPRSAIPDVVIIGAGAAGLAAARDCSEAGLTVTILEARGRIGGRIHTVRDRHEALPLELGAEFMHGTADETTRITRAAALLVDRLPDDHYYIRGGRLSSSREFWPTIARVGKDIARRLKRSSNGDFSMAEYLDRVELPSDVRRMLVGFVEGYHAAHVDLISARVLAQSDGELDDANGGADQQSRVIAGYDGVVHWLRAGLHPGRVTLRLNTVAHEIAWSAGGVSVRATTGTGAALDPIAARRAVIAVPHAILKERALRFQPALPEKDRAVSLLEIGHVFKIVLRFREAFWEEEDFVKSRLAEPREEPAELNFVHDNNATVPTWWTSLPAHTPRLTGWAGGPKAEALLARDEGTRVEQSLDSLSEVLRVPRQRVDALLESWAMHDWKSDPFSRGAYTYAAVGGHAAQKALARPVKGVLFFCGEATDAEETGTVSGALASGRRAARELLKERGT